MRSSYCGRRFLLTVLVILSLTPTLGRAGEKVSGGGNESKFQTISAEPLIPVQFSRLEEGSENVEGLPDDTMVEKSDPKTLVDLVAESPDAPTVKLVKANNAFAIKLYKQFVEEAAGQKNGDDRKNFCFSPYSIASVIQAIKVGTRGGTETELAKVMCLTISGDPLHQAYRTLLNMVSRFDAKSGFWDRPIEVKMANRIWFQERQLHEVLNEFLHVVLRYYDFGVDEVDFRDHEKAAATINNWVEKETEQYIKKLIHPDDFEDPTFFVATNAIVFRGKWCAPFSSADTRVRPFYDSDGKTKIGQVPMMSSKSENMNKVANVDGISVFQRPYYGNMSFVVLLPPAGKDELQKLEKSLSVEKLAKLMSKLDHTVLEKLEMPKFRIQSGYSLKETLQKLGMKKVFDRDAADFSGMISKESEWWPIWVYKILHKTVIEVDEVGTTAVASTGGMGMGGGGMNPKTFVADRPFLFLIFDDSTSTILFMGRYMGPDQNEKSVTAPVQRSAPAPRPRSRNRRGMGLF